MLVTVEKLKQYIETDKTNEVLEERLQALELSIRKYTNNNFQNRNVRFLGDIINGKISPSSNYIKVGDTIEISQSKYNSGLYTVTEVTDNLLTVKEKPYDEDMVVITKVQYPLDVQIGAIEIMRWKLCNEDKNFNPEAEKEVQSETISRHSVTYARDTTESDLDVTFGVPKKYLAFLKQYMKARF